MSDLLGMKLVIDTGSDTPAIDDFFTDLEFSSFLTSVRTSKFALVYQDASLNLPILINTERLISVAFESKSETAS
ncbi:hypothetical protein [Rhodococcoides fascians]|uniref:hypothetical protein n=1 Tax=Rhodococcoides fascians TaxID=1828 RepID=UPI001D648117|nr:hypothetical protein [Rhodococcus fascians]CAH0190441.1 hypothetical protein SRABI91_01660 [Rhodococcus fascians]